MKSLDDSKADLAAMVDVNDLLALACRAGLFSNESRYSLINDAWGNRIVWRVCRASNGDVRVAAISCGPNGRYENGAGDDIMFELCCHPTSRATPRQGERSN
jgi:hypothetical protein